MSDFLKNLRKQEERRRERNRRKYANPQYGGNERRGIKDRRRGPEHKTFASKDLQRLLAEILPVIKSQVEILVGTHKRLAEARERRLKAEERRTNAMESIAECLKHLFSRERIAAEPGGGSSADVWRLESDARSEKGLTGKEPADRKKALKIILNMRKKGLSYQKIAQILEIEGISTFSGKGKWHGQTVQKLYQQIT